MTITDVLVHVENEGTGARVAVAARLAGAGGRLTGFYGCPDIRLPVLTQSVAGTGLTEAIRQAADAGAATAKALFHRDAAGPETRWITEDGDLGEQLAAAARYSDLAVIGQPGEDAGEGWGRPTALLSAGLSAGVPVLVVPRRWSGPVVGTKILIAWNGSRESVRAVHQALPLLRTAAAVEVLVVVAGAVDPAVEPPGSRLLDHLARHGVAATAKSIAMEDTYGVGGALLARAAATGTDLLVMGAFGRSRLREAVVGSTTATLLTRASVPLFVVG